jgi:hypothetical protein
MADFWVDLPQLREAAEKIAALAKELDAEIAEISKGGNEVLSCLSGSSALGISEQLNGLSEELAEQKRNIEAMASVLDSVCDMYESTEKEVVARTEQCGRVAKGNDEKADVKKDSLGTKKAYEISYAALMTGIEGAFGSSASKLIHNNRTGNQRAYGIYNKATYIGEKQGKLAYTASQFNTTSETSDSPMGKQFGFSPEEEEILNIAYERFNILADYLGWDKKKKIHVYFMTLAALIPDYSSDRIYFELLAGSPSTEEAISLFDKMGLDGERLKEILTNQHNSAPALKTRDFAHECATIAVMSSDTSSKKLAGLADNVDAMAGYKGDIWSTQMGEDDIKSDISSINLFNRMINSEEDDLWRVCLDYNEEVTNGTINESLELLENYGDGDPVEGWNNLINEMLDDSIMTKVMFLHKGLKISPSKLDTVFDITTEDLEEAVEGWLDCIYRFFGHIKKESGVAIR